MSDAADASTSSLLQDHRQYSQMVQRIDKVMDLQVLQPDEEDSCRFFGHLDKNRTTPLRLAFIPSLLNKARAAWNKPSSTPLMPRRVDNLYRTHGDDTACLSRHPLPNSVIVNATQNRNRSSSMSAPSNKESRKLDMIGRCHYSLASFSLRNSNYMCAMEAYTRHVLLKLLPLLDTMPDATRDKALAYHSEIMSLVDYETIAARHAAEAASKQLATAVFLRRHVWLRTTTITDDARNRIEDSPFDGEGLFASSTDEALDNILKMWKTAKSYTYHGATSQRSFHPQGQPTWCRQTSSYQHRSHPRYAQSTPSGSYQRPTVNPRQRQCQSSRCYDRKQKA
ncbi:hypothetical protein JRQ81_014349 [Phrynocephalus forsythii]|uniref:Uncharacterized protein n=1 Tax=Phrynocephalus forsythii TaxID=171643 RepID=A0A9Q0XWI2_9SAUR|nr:hypothetical protein JRQ81_014349 [Phrynocephalus forsythii]